MRLGILVRRVRDKVGQDEIIGRSAELAYFFLLSVFPLLLFLLALFGQIVGESITLRRELFAYLDRVIPNQETLELVRSTVRGTIERRGQKGAFGLLAWLFIASQGMLAVSRILDAIYHSRRKRPWWKMFAIAAGLTVAFGVLIVAGLLLLSFGDDVSTWLADHMRSGEAVIQLWDLLRWPVGLVIVLFAFDLIYNFAPSELHQRQLHWISPGAVTGVTVWLLASFGFRVYLSYFDLYSLTYGSLGAVIILLLWFYLTGFAILLGGVVNSEIFKVRGI